jgi:hypothetical protein
MDKTAIQLIPGKWLNVFETWADKVQVEALLVSPYVARTPIEIIVAKWISRGIAESVHIRLIVDLAPESVLHGSLEPEALLTLVKAVPHTSVIHFRNLHAKVYIADDSVAIITSGNLTKSGLNRNFEYGVCLQDFDLIRQVRSDFKDMEEVASLVTTSHLEQWSNVASALRPLKQKLDRSAGRNIIREFKRRIEETELEVMRIRARGETDNSIYSKAILYLLKQHGSLTTSQLQPLVKDLLSDMCDDSLDRVIDGVHFGKRWKHMVRNAQQHLKHRGQIGFDLNGWFLHE